MWFVVFRQHLANQSGEMVANVDSRMMQRTQAAKEAAKMSVADGDLRRGRAGRRPARHHSRPRTRLREAHATELGMAFPRFTDDEGAKLEGLPGQITPGNMTLALLARELLAWAPRGRVLRLGTTFRGLALAGLDRPAPRHRDREGRRAAAPSSATCGWRPPRATGCVIGTATVQLP